MNLGNNEGRAEVAMTAPVLSGHPEGGNSKARRFALRISEMRD